MKSFPVYFWLGSIVAALALSTTAAYANMPILFVLFAAPGTMWWTIFVAIGIETAALMILFTMSWRRAIIASASINTVALVFAYFFYFIPLYPLLGWIIWHGSTIAFVGIMVGPIIIDTAIEIAFLRTLFVERLGWRRATGFFLANLMGAAVVLGVLYFDVVKSAPPSLSVGKVAHIEREYAAEIAVLREMLKETPELTFEGSMSMPSWQNTQWVDRRRRQLTPMRIARWKLSTSKMQLLSEKRETFDAFLLRVETVARYQHDDTTIIEGLYHRGEVKGMGGLVEYKGPAIRLYNYKIDFRHGEETYTIEADLIPSPDYSRAPEEEVDLKSLKQND